MTTIQEWLDNAKETINIIVFYRHDYHDDPRWTDIPWSQPLTPLKAHRWLNTGFSCGFGGQDVPEFHAWSADSVLCVHEYDGSTSLRILPRNPPGATT